MANLKVDTISGIGTEGPVLNLIAPAFAVSSEGYSILIFRDLRDR